MRDYPTLHEVLAIHAEAIKVYGGSNGVRDIGAIEAALFRPQSGYYADIIEEAAALMESLLINHPFVDGNKRVAFASCLSGYQRIPSGCGSTMAVRQNFALAWRKRRTI